MAGRHRWTEPEELLEPYSGPEPRAGHRNTEDLAEVRVALAPPGRALWSGLLLTALVGVLAAGLVALWPWLRPVHLDAEAHAQLFRTPLSVQDTRWADPENLTPDRFLTRFCGGALAEVGTGGSADVLGAQRVIGRGDTEGIAVSAAYPDAGRAEAAYRDMVGGMDGCTMRTRGGQSRWQATDSLAADGVLGQAFGLSGITSRGNFYRSVVVLQYANTVTVFLTARPIDLADTARAYRDRVAVVSRAQ
ncbi:hypothetical protein [Granulicoccus phenolivorans]|uniref:hypothetical protein n=1 Tax=Granulicoccus phenolivorans TaxID=266854 RepID=UPI000412B8F2|nr:hypothetical protein [Granulicoccus phenolivorans]